MHALVVRHGVAAGGVFSLTTDAARRRLRRREGAMEFNALVVERDGEGRTRAAVRRLSPDDLPEGEVTATGRATRWC
jgi:hypothetical protein